MTKNFARYAIFLNASAIAKMIAGDYKPAISLFQDALHVVQGMRQDDLDDDDNSMFSKACPTNWRCQDQTCPTGFAIFGQCFLVEPCLPSSVVTDIDTDTTVPPSVLLFQAVLGYNLALAHHATGHVSTALEFYQRTAQTAQHCDFVNAPLQAVALAVANNLAALALETYCDVSTFERYRTITRQLVFATSRAFPAALFFAQNCSLNAAVHERPAAAA